MSGIIPGTDYLALSCAVLWAAAAIGLRHPLRFRGGLALAGLHVVLAFIARPDTSAGPLWADAAIASMVTFNVWWRQGTGPARQPMIAGLLFAILALQALGAWSLVRMENENGEQQKQASLSGLWSLVHSLADSADHVVDRDAYLRDYARLQGWSALYVEKDAYGSPDDLPGITRLALPMDDNAHMVALQADHMVGDSMRRGAMLAMLISSILLLILTYQVRLSLLRPRAEWNLLQRHRLFATVAILGTGMLALLLHAELQAKAGRNLLLVQNRAVMLQSFLHGQADMAGKCPGDSEAMQARLGALWAAEGRQLDIQWRLLANVGRENDAAYVPVVVDSNVCVASVALPYFSEDVWPGLGHALLGLAVLLAALLVVARWERRLKSLDAYVWDPREQQRMVDYRRILAKMGEHVAVRAGEPLELARDVFADIAHVCASDRVGLWVREDNSCRCIALYDILTGMYNTDMLESPHYRLDADDEQGRKLAYYLKRFSLLSHSDFALHDGNDNIGWLAVEWKTEKVDPDPIQRDFLQHVARYFSMAIQQKSRQGQQKELLCRQRLQQGIAAMLQSLLASSDTGLSLSDALASLGEQAGWFDRIRLFRNVQADSGDLLMACQADWPAQGQAANDDRNSAVLAYNEFGVEFRASMLARKALYLKADGKHSVAGYKSLCKHAVVLVVPIFVDQEFYGVLVLGSDRDECPRHTVDIGWLDIVAGLLGMALRRQRARQDIALLSEAADKAKNRFVASMSHELRTPMNGLVGMAELLLATSLDVQQRQYVEIMRISGENLLALLKSLFDLGSLETNGQELGRVEFELRDAMEDVAELMAIKAFEKDLRLHCIIEPAVPQRLLGDTGRLRQVVIHLVDNAIKFTSHGYVSIHVALLGLDDGCATLRFEVDDTGSGVSDDLRTKLFDAFQLGDDAVNGGGKGAGLGLALAKQTVLLMGGEIGVDTHGAEGSRFWFTVRLNVAGGEDDSALEPDWQGYKVMVVDPSPLGRQALTTRLQEWALEVEEATDALQALGSLKAAAEASEPCRVVFVDQSLDNDGALELLELLHGEAALRQIPVVLTGAQGWIREGKEASCNGFAAFLTRPVRGRNLYDCLANLWNGRAAGAPRAAWTPMPEYHVLLVDDNLTGQLVAKAILTNLGCDVSVAENGAIALEMLKANRYDLVFMDCLMPVLDGYETTRRIRAGQGGAYAQVPIVAMTASALPGDREKCLDCGMDDYVCKPVMVHDLRDVLVRYLGTEPKSVTHVSLFDEQALLERFMGDLGLARMVLEGFDDDASGMLKRLALAIDDDNPEEVLLAARPLYTACANIGAHNMKVLLQSLIRKAEADVVDIGATPAIADALQDLQEAVRERLRSWKLA